MEYLSTERYKLHMLHINESSNQVEKYGQGYCVSSQFMSLVYGA